MHEALGQNHCFGCPYTARCVSPLCLTPEQLETSKMTWPQTPQQAPA
ncbi:hypothetical protein C7402_109271 [Paraburkholderia unamae]|uniref:Uncharacterized protein n=1 Tax=Paraburkholderia unamae TaxID=219649 RepID=A0ABX5KKM7_9BURK|nr:hypothetical protein C7402_109271 [Paraburkholderia unamae]